MSCFLDDLWTGMILSSLPFLLFFIRILRYWYKIAFLSTDRSDDTSMKSAHFTHHPTNQSTLIATDNEKSNGTLSGQLLICNWRRRRLLRRQQHHTTSSIRRQCKWSWFDCGAKAGFRSSSVRGGCWGFWGRSRSRSRPRSLWLIDPSGRSAGKATNGWRKVNRAQWMWVALVTM